MTDALHGAPDWAGGILTIDPDAIAANWRALRDRAAPAECGAVVKADAYGLGIGAVAPALAAAGCRTFFVAHLAEGVALRPLLDPDRTIFVLNGIPPGTEAAFTTHGLLPVLNSTAQVEGWRRHATALGRTLEAALQVDTGMSRFGLAPAEAQALLDDPAHLSGIALRLLMSHLGCADEPNHPANAAQLAAFLALRARLPDIPASLAASSGIFLGPAYHLDLVRPGAALYGVPPNAGRPNPQRPVLRLDGRVVQIRDVAAGGWVGYGASFRSDTARRIATVAVGYADGFFRASARSPDRPPPVAYADGSDLALPIVGRISMDSLALDVTRLPDGVLGEGGCVELIGPRRPLEDVAASAGTIGYEILTGLGGRFARRYGPLAADAAG